jgi:glycogen synthase
VQATLINHRYLPFRGGSELYIQKFAEWLVDSGWKARVVTTDAFDLEYFWDRRKRSVCAPRTEEINGVTVERLNVNHPIGSSLLFQGGRRTMGEASRLMRRVEPFRRICSYLPDIQGLSQGLRQAPLPDMIIGTNLGLETLAIAGLEVARELGVPFVLLPFAHIGGNDDKIARRYVSMPHQCELIRQSDLVIALTHIEAGFLEELGAAPHRLVVAGAGVELPTRAVSGNRKSCAQHDHPFTVLSIGAMARDKGTFDLVEASRMLERRGLCHRLILVGPELSAFTEWFRVSGASECEWIDVRGVVSESEKCSLLDEADVFALPSRTESFGIVYLEAWAHGLPVIGANVGAVSEVISDQTDGLLVPFGNPEAIASAIDTIANSPLLANSMARSGYAKIERHYGWSHVFGRIESAMSRVLGIEVL